MVGLSGVWAVCVWLQSSATFLGILSEPERFSWAEVGLVVALALVSGALFFARLQPILGRVLRSKKDADFSISPVGRRVRDFVWEVLCQGKVIKERPLPGLAHAFVFWGFLAFALVTLNHFATGVRLGFLRPASYVGSVLLLVCGGVGGAGRRVDCGPVCPAIFCAASVAG